MRGGFGPNLDTLSAIPRLSQLVSRAKLVRDQEKRTMGKNGILRLLALSLLATATGCPEDKQANQASVIVKVDPKELLSDGSEAEVTITAYNADRSSGEGVVTVSAAAGLIDGEDGEVELTLEDGKATTTFSCDIELDADCVGKVRITAVWNGVTGRTSAELPEGDGGMATADGMVSNGFSIEITRNRPSIYLGLESFSDLTVSLRMENGLPAKTQAVTLKTTLGTLIGTGTSGTMITETTDNNGQIQVALGGDEEAGTATVTATHVFSNAVATTTVAIKTLNAVTHVSTKCDNKACTIMGKAGSDYNETAAVTFKVTEAGGKIAEGVPVAFSLSENAPSGTTVTPMGVTDAKGEAVAVVTSGSTVGSFAVTATVIEGSLAAISPTIGVRGAKPSNQGFSFTCAKVNVSAYVSNTPPASYSVTCSFLLVDTTNNPVGTGAQVFFKTEAGSIPTSAASTAFSSTGTNANEGKGTVAFSTVGTWPPVDTTPLAADPEQYPNARANEPSAADGMLVRNPRDGLVTIIAYVRGEEYYDDDNGDGTWTAGERLYDMGEAFVDSNDNNVRDTGEFFVDDSPQNGIWDAPNGVWDSSTTIWAEARVLMTGRADPVLSTVNPSPFSGDCGSGLGKTEEVPLTAYLPDLNLNRVAAATVAISHTATKGTVSWIQNAVLNDGYGFDVDRLWVSAEDGTGCTPETDVCVRRVLFGEWLAGYAGNGKVVGAAANNVTSCQPDVVSVKATIESVATGGSTTGAIE